MAYILGVDIGTSGTKTVLFSEDGTPVASALYDYPLYTPCNGYAEQDPADWWNACVNSIRDVLNLQVNDIIPLNKPITDNVQLKVGSTCWFDGKLGTLNGKKAFRIDNILKN